jgi:hypothetical protein
MIRRYELTITRRNPTKDGVEQESLIRQLILDVASTLLGVGDTVSVADQNPEKIRERTTWRRWDKVWSVNWYRPNTHPKMAGEDHVPDFDFWVNDRRLANLESKNWKPKWPLSLDQAKEKILSRVAGRPVELGNILVISELLCEAAVQQQIMDLLREYKFKVLLTHRKTESAYDQDMYWTLRNRLKPILVYIFTLSAPRPNWALFSIATKPACLVILVLSMTPIANDIPTAYNLYLLPMTYLLPITRCCCLYPV